MLEFNRQPDVTAIHCVLRIPAIGHEDKGITPALHRQDEGGLRVERADDLRAGAKARIASSFHSPKMESAASSRAGFGDQPVQSEVNRKYFPPCFSIAGASLKRPGSTRMNSPACER